MDELPTESGWQRFKRGATDPKTIGVFAGALALAAAAAFAYYRVALLPLRVEAQRRFETHKALVRLYDLQMAHRMQKGTFANDAGALLAIAPDAQELRLTLQANADINTLTVVGDAEKFKLEANVLDSSRTLIKLKGPMGER
jgi:hypothetical protein